MPILVQTELTQVCVWVCLAFVASAEQRSSTSLHARDLPCMDPCPAPITVTGPAGTHRRGLSPLPSPLPFPDRRRGSVGTGSVWPGHCPGPQRALRTRPGPQCWHPRAKGDVRRRRPSLCGPARVGERPHSCFVVLARRHPALLAATVVIPLPAPRALGGLGYRWWGARGSRAPGSGGGTDAAAGCRHAPRGLTVSAAGWAARTSLPSSWSSVLPRGHPSPASPSWPFPRAGVAALRTLIRDAAEETALRAVHALSARRVPSVGSGAPSDLHVWAVSPVLATSPSLLARSGLQPRTCSILSEFSVASEHLCPFLHSRPDRRLCRFFNLHVSRLKTLPGLIPAGDPKPEPPALV